MTNLEKYNGLLAVPGTTPEQAAMGTPLGKSMQSLGYTKVTVTSGYQPTVSFSK
ncbi:hypothetical protein [Rhizobium lusitanum]|uniref:Uncharacterized protein n=1 Tax=Rhizobium lusitanum TaxID=293958 RepID=A0A7X0IW20_9HYPH|nr:hypothetical protein [Rhizobium lusitanum]MBB6487813.1 hypothetical protein [Rhizobium lusitanum]